MKRTFPLLALAAVLALAAPASALSLRSPVMTDADASQPQTVSAGQEFFVALPSNASTGYAWTASVADEKIVAYEGNVSQRAASQLPGAGGQQIFVFHANRSGSTTIAFSYAQSFEPNSPASKTLSFSVTVQ